VADPPDYQVPNPIIQVFESHDPVTGEPGFLLELSTGTYLFHAYSDTSRSLAPSTLEPVVGKGKSVVFDFLNRLVIRGTELGFFEFGSGDGKTVGEVPADSEFVCWNSQRAFVVSESEPCAFIASKRKISAFPEGFAAGLTCAAFFDNGSVVFGRGKSVCLFSLSGEITAIDLPAAPIAVEVADLQCYERTCLVLTDDSQLLAVHFLSRTVDVLAEEVSDFVVARTPFDSVVVLSSAAELRVIGSSQSRQLHGAVRAVIDALDSRVVSGLNELSESRKRLTLRQKLAEDAPADLPIMVSLFGTKPEPTEPIEPAFSSPKLWIENVRELSFEVHCDLDIPDSSDVVLGSSSCCFLCSCVSRPISASAIRVEVSLAIERMPRYEPFSVFLRTDDGLFSAGSVEFLVGHLTAPHAIPRIARSYFVSFPPHFRWTEMDLPGIEIADGGVILSISADSVTDFERQLVIATVHFPDGSGFVRREKTHFQVQAGKELGRFLQKFLTAVEANPDAYVDRKQLVSFQASAAELLSCILW
jgi:hypothetical protein